MSAAPGKAAGEPMRLGILLSGRGSNFLAIAESIRAGRLTGVEIAVVISNVAGAEGLRKARELGLANEVFVSQGRKRAEHDAEMIACLRAHRVRALRLLHHSKAQHKRPGVQGRDDGFLDIARTSS